MMLSFTGEIEDQYIYIYICALTSFLQDSIDMAKEDKRHLGAATRFSQALEEMESMKY